MADRLGNVVHRGLLHVWRYLPFRLRWLAIRVMFPRFPVGAVAIIRDAQGGVLLLRQTYHRGEQWGAPGGWVGRGELPRQAAAREAFEEVGLRVRVGRVLAVGSGPYGEITTAFECAVVGDFNIYISDEADRAEFFPRDSLPSLPSGHRRLIEEALAHDDPPGS